MRSKTQQPKLCDAIQASADCRRRGQISSNLTISASIAMSEANKNVAGNVPRLLSTLAEVGLVYKNRHGKYSLAVPLLGQFIQRQTNTEILLKTLE
jgi:hypothetical protein